MPISPLAGVQPLSFTVTGGSFPAGIRLDGQSGLLTGSAIASGTMFLRSRFRTRFLLPEVVTVQVTVVVIPPRFSYLVRCPARYFATVPSAAGLLPSEAFRRTNSRCLPALFRPVSVPSNSIRAGSAVLRLRWEAISSRSTFLTRARLRRRPATTSRSTVVDPIGRNDTIATATPIIQDGFFYGEHFALHRSAR